MSGRVARSAAALGASAVLTVGLGLGASPASAYDGGGAGILSTSPDTGVDASGDTVTVSGSGFSGTGALYVALCDYTEYVDTGEVYCDLPRAQVAPLSSGSFSGTTLAVVGSFAGMHYTGSVKSVTCKGLSTPSGHQCAVMTSNTADGTQDVAWDLVDFD